MNDSNSRVCLDFQMHNISQYITIYHNISHNCIVFSIYLAPRQTSPIVSYHSVKLCTNYSTNYCKLVQISTTQRSYAPTILPTIANWYKYFAVCRSRTTNVDRSTFLFIRYSVILFIIISYAIFFPSQILFVNINDIP